MKKSNGLMTKRNRIIPNERRRQTWRKHRLNLIDRRSKWFYQQQGGKEPVDPTAAEAHADITAPATPEDEDDISG